MVRQVLCGEDKKVGKITEDADGTEGQEQKEE